MDYKELAEYTINTFERLNKSYNRGHKYFIINEEQNLLWKDINNLHKQLDLLEIELSKVKCRKTRRLIKKKSKVLEGDLETYIGKHNITVEFFRRIEDGVVNN